MNFENGRKGGVVNVRKRGGKYLFGKNNTGEKKTNARQKGGSGALYGKK